METMLAGALSIATVTGKEAAKTLTWGFERAAPLATETFTRSRLGPATKTRRTVMSDVPKPTAICPEPKFKPVVSISTVASAPAGSDAGTIAAIVGWADAP